MRSLFSACPLLLFFPRRACLQVVGHEGGTDDKHKEVVDLHSTGNLLCDAFGLQPNEADFEKSCLKDAVPWLEGVAKSLQDIFFRSSKTRPPS